MEKSGKIDQMGTQNVLSDLQKKFGTNPGAPSTEDSRLINDTARVLSELNQKRAAFQVSLNGLPVEHFLISLEEMQQIREVNVWLYSFVQSSNQDLAGVESQERAQYWERKYLELLKHLDGLKIWHAKFATESSGGASVDIPLQEYNQATDSLYYMTPSGATLRLKTIELVNGLQQAVQPFMEKVLFENSDGESSELPQRGFNVLEYRSNTFVQALTDTVVYQSGLDIYRKDNHVAAVLRKDSKGNQVSEPNHSGDRVNKIFFSRD